MPFLAPVFAAIGTALGTVGVAVAGAVGLGGIVALAPALAIGIGAVTVGLTAASLLSHHSNINSGAQIQFKADKTAGVPYLMGRTGTGGNIVFQDSSNDGHNKWIHSFVVFSHGPVDSFVSFNANQTAVSFTAKLATTAPWTGKMWLDTEIGAQPASYIAAPSGTGTVPEWTSSHKLSGLASCRWVAQSDSKAYPTGLPQPLWVWKGVPVYDPRLDSTYPGGSGTQRLATPSTWAWSENPWLHALTFCIGQTANSIRVIGLGASSSQIDFAAFVTAANVADANSWKIGGVITSKDSKWDVLKTICQAGGGQPIRQGATISCIVFTPLTSVATLTGADVVGEAQITGSQPRRTRINAITPTYRSEAHNWEMVAADPVVVAGYVTADGQQRSRATTYALVQQVNQAAQLAYYDIANGREFGPVVLPLKTRWNGLKPGDCVTFADNEYGMSSQTLLIISRQRDPSTGMPTFTCISETNAKHAAALALSGTAPPTPTLAAIDLNNVPAPDAGDWTAATSSFTANGITLPAIVVTGAVSNPNAEAVIFRIRVTGSGSDWTSFVPEAVNTTRKEITAGLTPSTDYDIAIAYRQRGVISPDLVLSAITSGLFVGGSSTVADGDVLYDSAAPGAFSFTVPSNGLAFVDIHLFGGGGGGGLTHGGGGSGYSFKDAFAVTPGTTVIAGTIGAGGRGEDASGTPNAAAGGASTVTTPALTANGGGSGHTAAGSAGTASGGTTNTTGEAGDTGGTGKGGANLGADATYPGGARQSTLGNPGNAPGGGGAAASGSDGGRGANGRVVIVAKSS